MFLGEERVTSLRTSSWEATSNRTLRELRFLQYNLAKDPEISVESQMEQGCLLLVKINRLRRPMKVYEMVRAFRRSVPNGKREVRSSNTFLP